MKLKIPITRIKYDSLVNKAGLDQSYNDLSVFFLSKMKNLNDFITYTLIVTLTLSWVLKTLATKENRRRFLNSILLLLVEEPNFQPIKG